MNLEQMTNKVICNDCLKVMKEIPDSSIDLLLTDPPYGINAGRGTGRSIRVAIEKGKIEGGDWDKQIPTKNYFDEIFRISKYQIIFGGNYFPLPTSKSFIIWDKGETMYNRDFAECEFIWVTPDKPAKIFKKSPTQLDRTHPTQKPVELMLWILQNYSEEDNLILDPFAGSGSTLIACQELHRNFIGIEISEKYCEIARERLKQKPLF